MPPGRIRSATDAQSPMPAGSGRRPRRRDLLRAGMVTAAGFTGGVFLGGTGAARAAAARPSRAASSPIVLTVLPSQSWPGAIQGPLWGILHQAMEPFLAQNPGVEVNLFNNQGYQGATQAAMLAGAGPDVFSDWIMPPFVQNNLMLDMAPYIKRDNMDTGIFPPGEMSFFQEAALFSPTNQTGLYAVPAYLHTEAYAVNLTILDELGLKYPQPDWTIKEWTALWQASTIRASGSKKPRFGTNFDMGGYDYSYNMITPFLFYGFGGEYVDPGNPTKSYLTSPGSLDAGRWVYDLVWSGVAGSGGSFTNGTLVSDHGTCTCGGQVSEAQQWRGFKWDYFEDPVWPVRKSSYAASDFYAIWSGTRHPEQAWALLKWLAFGPDWQRIVMKTALAGPNQAQLWEEWTRLVRQFAPPLREKNLEAFSKPVLNNEPYFGHVFRYSEAQVKTIVGKYSALLAAKKMTVEEAFGHMNSEINAAQQAGAAEASAAAAASKQFGRFVTKAEQSQAPIPYPEPPRQGPGTAAVAAPELLRTGTGGKVSLTGEGGGLYGGSDGLTFAGSAFNKSKGVFVARLVSLAAVKGTGLSDGAKIGLLARSDLSNSAGEVALGVAMGRGLHLMVRPFAGGQGGDNKPPSATNEIDGQAVLALDSKAASNYLLKPVWLKLVLDVDRWTAYSSLDGQHWTQAYQTFGAAFVGAWVGLFATPHGGNEVRAVFDHLSGFTPTTVVRIGS